MEQFRRIWNRIRRGVVYALLLLVFWLLQVVILSHITVLGVHAVIMPALVVAVGLFEGGWRGGMFGLAAGIICDLSYTTPTVLFTVLFPIFGFVEGFLTEFLINRRFYAYFVSAAGALMISGVLSMMRLLLSQPDSRAALWGSCITQVLLALPFAVAAYYACLAVPRRD